VRLSGEAEVACCVSDVRRLLTRSFSANRVPADSGALFDDDHAAVALADAGGNRAPAPSRRFARSRRPTRARTCLGLALSLRVTTSPRRRSKQVEPLPRSSHQQTSTA
jgi:hypothetical protein